MIKPGSVFVNSARGELVDADALIARLNKRDIFACLDVFDVEPLPSNHPLRKMPNVFITSHIAGGTGVWGQIPMVAHPNISQEDAEAMVKYVLSIK